MKKREQWGLVYIATATFFAFWIPAMAYIVVTDVVASEVGKCTIKCVHQLSEPRKHGLPPREYCTRVCRASKGQFQSSLPDQVRGITDEEIMSSSTSRSTPPTETSDTRCGQETRCSSPAGDATGKESQ